MTRPLAGAPEGLRPGEDLGPRLAVLGVAPLLTVTIESRSDRDEVHLHVGGQGYWIARLASELGAAVTLCTTVGGETGAVVTGLLERTAFDVHSIGVTGANGSYVHDRRRGERKVIAHVAAQPLDRHEGDDLFGAALSAATRCGALVLAGMPDPDLLPDGFYRRLAADARAARAVVVADVAGDTMREVLAGGVDVLKISDEELHDAGRIGSADADTATIATAMEKLQHDGARCVVVTRSTQGTVVRFDEVVVEVRAPTVEVVDGAGAGDSLTASLAVALAAGGAVLDGVCLGTAAAALNVTRHGLGSGRQPDIEAFADRVIVTEVAP